MISHISCVYKCVYVDIMTPGCLDLVALLQRCPDAAQRAGARGVRGQGDQRLRVVDTKILARGLQTFVLQRGLRAPFLKGVIDIGTEINVDIDIDRYRFMMGASPKRGPKSL